MHDVAPTEEVDDGPKTTTFSFMDNEVEEDEAVSTHPTVLPPKKTVKQSDGQSRIGGASSIKRLVENIAANKGIGAEESRFANLYRESVGAQNTENADKPSSVGSKFGALIDSMRNGAASTKQSAAPKVDESSTQRMNQNDSQKGSTSNELQKDSEDKGNLNRWKGHGHSEGAGTPPPSKDLETKR